MARFVEGMDRGQATLLPECLEDWVDENNPVRAVDVFVEALDLAELGFDFMDFLPGNAGPLMPKPAPLP
jgi:transposase